MASVFDDIQSSTPPAAAAPTTTAPTAAGGSVFDDLPAAPPPAPAVATATNPAPAPSPASGTSDKSGSVFDGLGTAKDDSVLSRLKAVFDNPRSFFNPENFLTTKNDPVFTQTNAAPGTPAYYAHQKALADKSVESAARPIITFEGAMTAKEAKEHPEEYGLYQMLTGFTSPEQIAMAVGTEGFGALSKTGLRLVPALVSAGFSYSQISDALEKVPKIKSALNRGDEFEAKRLITQAAAEGGLGLIAGYHGASGTLTAAREALSSPAISDTSKAMQHNDFDQATRDFVSKRQIAHGQQDQIAQLGLKSTPDQLSREHLTEFVEAGQDRAELAKRQKETLAGPTPQSALDAAQGKTVSLDEQAQSKEDANTISKQHIDVTVAADGPEWERKLTATNDKGKNIGSVGYKVQPDGRAQIYGSVVDEASRGNGVGQELYKNAFTDAKKGGAKVITSDPTNTTADAARVWDKLKTRGYDVEPITHANGKPGFQLDLSKIDEKGDPNTTPKPPALRPGVTDDPEMRKLVEGAGGVYRGQSKDGKVEITLPRSMTDGLNLPEVMKDFVSATVDAKDVTPESIKEAIDRKFKEMGGVPKPSLQKDFEQNLKDNPANPFVPAGVIAEKEPPKQAGVNNFVSPAAQQTLDLQKALDDARTAAAGHVPTAEERARMAAQQDPDRPISNKSQSALDYSLDKMDKIKKELQRRGLLPQGALRSNYVPHNWGFDDESNVLRQRLYDTYHAGQQAGLVAPNKDFFAATADYIGRTGKQLATHDYIANLKRGRTSEGQPLAVPGGYVDGQHVSAEGPQSYIIPEEELNRLKSRGQLNDLIRDGKVVQNPDKSFTMKADDYVKTGLYETRPIGPTPIPPNVLEEMTANGSLEALEKKGLVYKDEAGNYFNKENLYARVPIYAHPDVADYMNKAVVPAKVESTPALNFYDKLTGNLKSLLLSWSPFHKVTEALRMGESMGLSKAAKTYFMAPDVDYFNLKPEQIAAIRDGIVAANPTGASSSHVEEGLGVEKGTVAAKSYKLFNSALEKLHVPESIRNYIDPQKILNDNVFGPNGTITHAKFALYDQIKPEIIEAVKADHPNWAQDKIEDEAGRKAAQFANNKFGGFNNILAGRGLASQKFLRRVLLAPDFLETTGRSVLDLVDPYGAPLVRNMLKFQLTAGLTAAAINYAYHHDESKKQTPESVADASHILDHPFEVVSPDGKTIYGMRTTVNDFLHMIKDPRTFGYDRLAPAVRSVYEILTQRNAYGRKESIQEALKSVPKAGLPIWLQSFVGLGNTGLAEPTKTDQVLKAVGIGGRPARTEAEQFALQKVSEHLQGQEALQGQALVRQQMKLRAEDKLRDAYQVQDPDQKKTAVQDALTAINNLTMRKLLTPDEKKKVITDARSSRLVSIFNSLTPADALTTWDKATDKEKQQLGVAMHSKYVRWIEHMQKNGVGLGNLNEDDQKTFSRFKAASAELQALESRPRPVPTPVAIETTPQKGVEKASPVSGTSGGSIFDDLAAVPSPVVPTPPGAPAVYKGGDYTPIIDRAADRYGVEPGLIHAMMKQESGGNPNATSGKGAKGLMQLLPSTANTYGVKDINDPEQNIDAGVHYMADLLKRYEGNEEKALAAYNAGPDAVDKYNGVPPYKETKGYVENIQKSKPLPKNFTPTAADVEEFKTWKPTGPKDIPGMVEPGNIDLSKRPLVHHSDGSVSSLYSYSFGTEDGEVLIPGVSPEGKMLTEKQAEKLYEESGQHLGIFKSPESADAYANMLHEKQGAYQTYKNGGKYKPSVETYDRWKPKKE